MYTSIDIYFKDLILDEQNPRFVTNEKRKPTSNEIMEYLIKYENVIELAESINEYSGLIPGERLLVMKDNNKYIVLEGNRRTAAISLLLYPEKFLELLSLSSKDKSKIKSFIDNVSQMLKKQLTKFQVDTVPNRDKAIYSLTERHIDGIKKWSQISKMYFYKQHFDSGKTLKDLEDFTGESPRSIADTLRKYSYLRFVLDSYRNKYPDAKFNITDIETQIPTELIIQRIYNSLKDGLQFIFDESYNLITINYNKKQLNLLKSILADIAYLYWDLEKINTRNLNKVDDFTAVFFDEKHKESSEESLNIGHLITELEESLIKNPNINVIKSNGQRKTLIDQEKEEIEDEEDSDNSEKGNSDMLSDNDERKQDDKEEDGKSPDEIKDGNKSNDYIGRLRDPSTYKYLTSVFPVKKRFKENARINALKKEIGSLEYKEYTISAMFLIRSLLETYTHEYIDYFANLPHDNSLRMKSVQRQRKDRKQSLQDLITGPIYNHLKNTLNNYAETYEVIETTLSNNNNTALTQIINHHIHSTNNYPEESEILNAWSKGVIMINTLDDVLFENLNTGLEN